MLDVGLQFQPCCAPTQQPLKNIISSNKIVFCFDEMFEFHIVKVKNWQLLKWWYSRSYWNMKFNVFKRNLCELWISWKNCHKSCSYQEISVPKRTWDLLTESHLRLVIWRMKNGTKRKSEFRCPFIKFVLALYDFVLRILFKTKVMIIITFNALNIFILILLTWLAFWFFYILNSLFYDKVFKLLDLWIVS